MTPAERAECEAFVAKQRLERLLAIDSDVCFKKFDDLVKAARTLPVAALLAELDRLRPLAELAAQLPPKLHSDWRDTNHYELTCRDVNASDDDFFWLMVGDGTQGIEDPNWCETETGKRLGLLMDIAAEVGRLRDEGVLTPAGGTVE